LRTSSKPSTVLTARSLLSWKSKNNNPNSAPKTKNKNLNKELISLEGVPVLKVFDFAFMKYDFSKEKFVNTPIPRLAYQNHCSHLQVKDQLEFRLSVELLG
jgi:hypothetical protein